jgi:hypothetical protein
MYAMVADVSVCTGYENSVPFSDDRHGGTIFGDDAAGYIETTGQLNSICAGQNDRAVRATPPTGPQLILWLMRLSSRL